MVILPFITIAATHQVIKVVKSIEKRVTDPEGLVEGSTVSSKIERH